MFDINRMVKNKMDVFTTRIIEPKTNVFSNFKRLNTIPKIISSPNIFYVFNVM